MSDAEFDRFAGDYDRLLGKSLSNAAGDGERFAEYKVGEMSLDAASPARVLDFGCGVGRSLTHLRRYFPSAQLAGYDPSGASLSEARKRAPEATLYEQPGAIPEASFDLILMANVMHHIPLAERASTMSLCARLLAPSGSLHVFEHNPYNPVTRRVFDRCPFDRDASMLRKAETMSLGESVGLRVASARYTLFLPFANRGWLRTQRLLSWLPAGAQYHVRFQR